MLELDELVDRCETLRGRGARIVLTNGCFDLLHVGHARLLRQARELGDALVVALNNDASARVLKGPGRPIIPERQRAELLAALASVDYVTIFAGPTAARVVELVRPDIYVKGGDYSACRDGLPEVQAVTRAGGMAVFLDYTKGASTTAIIQSIVAVGAATPQEARR
ncbi:MAG: adenylyltransferase/cytidyltransferase family protein [Chloroflexi bacterium]|nr:adenylyltransferase/cytidyltransferase family protein [Chloroflexota bacterium]